MNGIRSRIERLERLAAKAKAERSEPIEPSAPVYGRRASGFVQLGLTVKPEAKELLRDAADGQGVTMSELLDAILEDALTAPEMPARLPAGFKRFSFRAECPKCGNGFMHHGTVAVWNRHGEDSNVGTHVTVSAASVAVDPDAQNGNPSRRRDGLLIDIDCESCSEVSQLAVIQHKGETFVVYPWDEGQPYGGDARVVAGER